MATVIQIQPKKSSFDDHHPPEPELIDQCVHCGFCLPTCPTYALWGEEMDSPRGRIYLMKLATEGQISINDKFVGHMDACLGCMACMTACPSGVNYEHLIAATRAQIERNYSRGKAQRRARKLLFEVFPYPQRLRALAAPAWLYQKSGLQKLLRETGVIRLLPARLRSMESLLPPLHRSERLSNFVPARGMRRARVGLMTGCVQRVFFSQVNSATARVLAAEGCDVVIPEQQSCCGALMAHSGLEEDGQVLARRMIDVFEKEDVDAIVINSAGCGSSMKAYGHLLRDDPDYAERARAFAAKCKDISEVLDALGPRAPRNPVPVRVAYHDSCHLQHAQGVRVQPRTLLKAIPGLQLLDIPESAICCGSAGIYNLVEPKTAEELGDRKAANILSVSPELIATGNPGCLLQIHAAIERRGAKIPIVHFIELLDQSISEGSRERFRWAA